MMTARSPRHLTLEALRRKVMMTVVAEDRGGGEAAEGEGAAVVTAAAGMKVSLLLLLSFVLENLGRACCALGEYGKGNSVQGA